MQSTPIAGDTAIVANKQLASLSNANCNIPCEANRYMFRSCSPLTALTELRTGSQMFSSISSFEQLVAVCPALQQLVTINYRNSPDCDDFDFDVNLPSDLAAVLIGKYLLYLYPQLSRLVIHLVCWLLLNVRTMPLT